MVDTTIRVLLIGGGPGTFPWVQGLLADADLVPTRFALRHDERPSTGLMDPADEPPDVILLDRSSPGGAGLETFHAIQARAPGVPTVVLCERSDVAFGVVGAGAHDVLIRGQVTGPLLARSLRCAIERGQLEGRLRQAEERAAAAERTRGRFLARMNHEIRTPLNAILGMTELALEAELPVEAREHLRVVKSAALSLLPVLRDFLDDTRSWAGMRPCQPVAFRLRACLAEVMSRLAVRAHSKGLELAYRVDPIVPDRVIGHPLSLSQILINLVDNATKFTDCGEVFVEIEAEAGPRAGGEVLLRVAVKDTGAGIPREKLGAIFTSSDDDDDTRCQCGESALDLGVTARLVEAMGGRIWAESEPGRGSTVLFTARLAADPEPSAAQPACETQAMKALRVLVVDDNATQRRILAETLARWNALPTTAEGGRAAMAALEHARLAGIPFHLVLIDDQMPDIDGLALAERIRHAPGMIPGLILLRTTARAQADPERHRVSGILGVVTKPAGEADLRAAILNALGRPTGPADRSGTALGPPPHRATWRPLRVLLAEDNLFNQGVTSRMVENLGHAVVIASTGAEALEVSARQPFDLVLMDVQMPGMDGLQATAAIRARERGTGDHVPIVAMTAFALREDRDRCLDSGMDAYLSKPVEVKDLIEVIESTVLSPRDPGARCLPAGRHADRPDVGVGERQG